MSSRKSSKISYISTIIEEMDYFVSSVFNQIGTLFV